MSLQKLTKNQRFESKLIYSFKANHHISIKWLNWVWHQINLGLVLKYELAKKPITHQPK